MLPALYSIASVIKYAARRESRSLKDSAGLASASSRGNMPSLRSQPPRSINKMCHNWAYCHVSHLADCFLLCSSPLATAFMVCGIAMLATCLQKKYNYFRSGIYIVNLIASGMVHYAGVPRIGCLMHVIALYCCRTMLVCLCC